MAILFSNTQDAHAAASSLTSTAPPACGAAAPLTKLAAGSTTHSPKIPISPIAPNSKDGSFFIFRTQQARWAKGLIQVSKKILPQVFASDVSRHVKIEAVYHLTANLSYPLMIVLSVLLLPAMVIRFYQGWFQMLYIDLPLFLASTFSISSFYLVSQKELFPKRWLKSLLYLPLLMSLGIGLTITNTRAVLEALVGRQTSFVRTPKYRVESKKDRVGAKKYRKRLGWVPWIELLIGTYFALAVSYAIDNENYITVPFLLLFVIGYWVTGLMSLLQGRFTGLSVGSESHTKPFPVGV